MITCKYIVTPENITLSLPGEASRTIPRASGIGNRVMQLLADASASVLDLIELLRAKNPIVAWVSQDSEIKILDNNQVYFRNERLPESLEKRIVAAWGDGSPFAAILLFVRNLWANPSMRSRNELFTFLQHENLPFTQNGTFLAYKAVRNDWLDKHSGTFRNYPGDVLTMPRSKVDDEAHRGCSYGYHVGSLEYVKGFACGYGSEGGDRIVLVEVNPADVVCVPYDSQYMKVRTCKYKVLSEFRGALPSTVVKSAACPYDKAGIEDQDLWPDDDECPLQAKLVEEIDELEEDLETAEADIKAAEESAMTVEKALERRRDQLLKLQRGCR